MVGNMKCKKCHSKLSTSEHGYYCSNNDCSLFDKDILAYENTTKKKTIKKKYVVTSGRGINLVLHRDNFSTIQEATKKAKKIKEQNKIYVAIKKIGEYGMSHVKYI